MKRKIVLICIGCLSAFFLSVLADRVVGYFLNKYGYFKVYPSKITEVFDTSEFKVTTQISSQGIRNREVVIPKPENTYRILVVGDSFVYGWGVRDSETWVSLLEKQLRIPGKKIEFINAGMSGAAPTEVRYVCRSYADQFEADAIVYGLYGDDIYQAAAKEQSQTVADKVIGELWPIFSRLQHPIIAIGAEKILPGTRIEYRKLWAGMASDLLQENPGILDAIDPRLHSGFRNGYISPWIMYFSFLDPHFITFVLEDEFANFAFTSLDERLAKFKGRCSGNLPTAVIYFPSKEAISSYYFPFSRQLGYSVDQKLLTNNNDLALRPLVEKHGMLYLSVISLFRKDGCKDCYYAYDRHLTAVGNKKAADYLAPLIQEWISKEKE